MTMMRRAPGYLAYGNYVSGIGALGLPRDRRKALRRRIEELEEAIGIREPESAPPSELPPGPADAYDTDRPTRPTWVMPAVAVGSVVLIGVMGYVLFRKKKPKLTPNRRRRRRRRR